MLKSKLTLEEKFYIKKLLLSSIKENKLIIDNYKGCNMWYAETAVAEARECIKAYLSCLR